MLLSAHGSSKLLFPSFLMCFYLHLGPPSVFFLQVSAPKPCIHFPFSPIRVTWPAHLSFFDLMTRKTFVEKYRLQCCYLCSRLHSPVTSSILGPNIRSSTSFSNTPSLSILYWEAVERILWMGVLFLVTWCKHHASRHNTPIHNILSTGRQLSISQKALGKLPEDGNVVPKHVGDTIHN
jgi:hypothetical protein